MAPLKVRAYAKVNLALEVLGRRSDGYHEVRTLLQTIELWDDLDLAPAKGVSVECEGLDVAPGEELSYRAALLLQKASPTRQGAAISLFKGIPVAAGLGGGSSDAAASLLALRRLWHVDLSWEALHGLAAQLGADVPFFLAGGTALASGRGDVITALPPLPETWLVLLPVSATLPSKTAALYAKLRSEHFGDGSSVDALADALRAGRPVREEWMVNTFEQVADDVYPGHAERRQALSSAVGGSAHLSGAGPSLFALVAGRGEGERACLRLRTEGLDPRLVRTVASTMSSPALRSPMMRSASCPSKSLMASRAHSSGVRR